MLLVYHRSPSPPPRSKSVFAQKAPYRLYHEVNHTKLCNFEKNCALIACLNTEFQILSGVRPTGLDWHSLHSLGLATEKLYPLSLSISLSFSLSLSPSEFGPLYGFIELAGLGRSEPTTARNSSRFLWLCPRCRVYFCGCEDSVYHKAKSNSISDRQPV